MAFFYLVLLLSPPEMLMGTNSMAGVVAATRPLETKSPNYETLKPKTKHGQQDQFHGGEVENCLPKGFHHNSAPSRYINYHPLGSTILCATSKHADAPWKIELCNVYVRNCIGLFWLVYGYRDKGREEWCDRCKSTMP
jgi:hypothetical protein